MPSHYTHGGQSSGPSLRRRRWKRRRKVRPPKHGKMGYNNGNNVQQYSSEMPNSNGHSQTNLRARPGQFINQRTGHAVPTNSPYHIHPDKGPMAGAVHNPDIPGGTAGHDYYEPRGRRRRNGMNGV